jgi:serine protease Do
MTFQCSQMPASGARATRRAVLRSVGLVAAGLLAISARAEATAPPVDLADLTASLLPSVVSISTVVVSPTGLLFFVGSGFILTRSGIIATNRHVAAGASKITVTVPGIGPLSATPLYVAEYLDFALLKVDATDPLLPVRLGDSDTVRIGDSVLLLGNPLGVGESLSVGVISALNRDIGDGRFDRFFQTDAAINHGNSGGPMFNIKGDVIAINTALDSSPGNTGSIGIGFALPINDVKLVVDQYLRNGKVVVGSTGVRAQHMTPELTAAFGIPQNTGSIVTEVLPGGSAEGKLRPGDVMLKVGTQDAADTSALARLIVSSIPGTTYAVSFLRDGRKQTTMITISREEIDPLKAMALSGTTPEEAGRFMKPSDPGFEVAAIGPVERRRFALSADANGVVVTHVDPHSAASRGIEAGDIITSINGSSVNKPFDIEERLRALSGSDRASAALLVIGARGTRWVAVPLQSDR